MIRKIAESIRLMNRWRLTRRYAKRHASKQLSLDFNMRRANLGAALPSPNIKLAIGLVAAEGRDLARFLRSLAVACQCANIQADDLLLLCTANMRQLLVGYREYDISYVSEELTGDWATQQNTLMQVAFQDRSFDIYIGMDGCGVFHPDALRNLMAMHAAQLGACVLGFTPFPRQQLVDFDANNYDAKTISACGFLMPKQVWMRCGPLNSSASADMVLKDFFHRAKADGMNIKICPTAFIATVGGQIIEIEKDKLTVICRYHNPSRIFELKRAVFSLANVVGVEIELVIVTQNFNEEELNISKGAVNQAMAASASHMTVKWIEHRADGDADVRAKLLNLGLRARKSRYVAFLDHDDTVCSDGYIKLINDLKTTHATLSFGAVSLKYFDCFDEVCQLESIDEEIFSGGSLVNMFRNNICPIHSYVLDTQQVSEHDLMFDESFNRCEDYEFLLRICARYPSSFAVRNQIVSDYYMKSDGSNSTRTVASNQTFAAQRMWLDAKDKISNSKGVIRLSDRVLDLLGFKDFKSNMTIAEALLEYENAGRSP